MPRAQEQHIWLVYPEYRKLRVPYRYNGYSFLDAMLPAPSNGRFLGKSGLGPYFLVSTPEATIQTAPGWNAMPYKGAPVAASLDPRCAAGQITVAKVDLLTRRTSAAGAAGRSQHDLEPAAA